MASLKRRIENGTTTVNDSKTILTIFVVLFIAGIVTGFIFGGN